MAKTTSKKKSPSKKKTNTKSTAKKKTAAKPKSTKAQSAGAGKKTAAKKKPSVKELLSKKFEPWQPEKLYTPPAADSGSEVAAAPPFVPAEKAEAVRPLLFKKFDLSSAEPEKPKAKKAAAPAQKEKPPKVVSQRELLQKKFDAWKPSSPFKPAQPEARDYTAPPIASGPDAERIRSLLLQKIDLSDVKPAQPAPPPKAQAPPEKKAPAPEEKAPAPEKPPKVVSQRELLQKKFDAWKPASPFKPAPPEARDYTAPPIASGSDAERIRSLLLQKIDLSDVPPRPPAEPAKEAEVVDQKTEVPEEIKTAPAEPAVEEVAEEKTEAAPEAEVVDQKTEVPEEIKTAPGHPAVEAVAEEKAPAPETVAEEDAEEAVESKAAVPPPTVKKGSDPMETTMKIFAACLAVVFALILWASFSNAAKYYLVPTDQGLEIWKGSFAPLGKERVVRLPDVSAPATIGPVYAQNEVYPIAFDYYMNRADALLLAPGTPDYEGVEANLNKAVDYATKVNAKQAFSKMKDLRLIILMNKADIAATRGTEAGLKEAIAYLEQAAAFDRTDLLDLDRKSKAELIEKKIEVYRSLLQGIQGPPEIVAEPAPAES